MALRYMQITAQAERIERLRDNLCEHPAILDQRLAAGDNGERTLFVLAGSNDQQSLLDAIQGHLGEDPGWRMVVLPVEAALPAPERKPEAKERLARADAVHTREELYNDIERSAQLDANYLLLTALSTLVVTIGLSENNVAVIIGAMVIAPLLGPNLALILATALGDKHLLRRALVSGSAGVALAIALAFALGVLAPLDLAAEEVLARTDVSFSSVALALASGAAAALSTTTGLSSTLVGVMVAVALLPPAAVVGLMLAAERPWLAFGALALLAANVVCVNLAGQVVFLAKKIRPRTWLEKQSARQSVRISLMIWAGCLIALAIFLLVKSQFG